MMTIETSITPESVLVPSADVLFQEVGGEAVLLDLGSEQYFGLNTVGSRAWTLLDGKATLADVHQTLCNEFDADANRIGDDLLALAQSLAKAGLARAG